MARARLKMELRQRQNVLQRLKLKRIVISSVSIAAIAGLGFLAYFNVGVVTPAKASTLTTIDSGSYIINMGIVPQTTANALVPYGMVYDLVQNYLTPVDWVINDTKIKDGTDFTYNAVNYKGGPFIIEAKYINSAIKSRITYWAGQGVVGLYTTAAVTVPVYCPLTAMPRIFIDNSSGKESIIISYLTAAMLPSSVYTLGVPSGLTGCTDLWVNPHGDPTWASHSYLYNFATTNGSFVFSECHATSMMEGCKNTVAPFQQLNFLTTNGLKCYGSNQCQANITETHGGNPTSPFTYNYPTEPVMQFMGAIDAGITGGSETWYIPQSTGQWRPTTHRGLVTADGISPGEGVLIAYGPAFGLANAGMVMYEASHDLSGTSAVAVGAQRAFFNFMFLAAATKSVTFSTNNIPTDIVDSSSTTFVFSVNVGHGTSPFSYQWACNLAQATFGSPNASTTTFKLPGNIGKKAINVTIKVIDACGRQDFLNRPINITTNPSPLPVTLSGFTATVNSENDVQLNWTTVSERNNDFFTIERSSNGTQYSELARLKGAGNSNNLLRYSYLDKSPIPGTSYYRLKQTDYNGKTETFNIVPVKLNAGSIASLKIYPNPISSSFIAEFESAVEQEVEIQVINMQGGIVESQKVMALEGRNSCRINLSKNIIPGTYVVRMIDSKKVCASLKISMEE